MNSRSAPKRIPGLPLLSVELRQLSAGDTLYDDDPLSAGDDGVGILISEQEFAEFARRDGADAPMVILLSGGEHICSRRSIAALRPALIFEAKGRSCTVHSNRGTHSFEADPFEAIDQLLAPWCSGTGEDLQPLIAGYAAYEAGRVIEELPCSVTDELALPDIWLCWPARLHIRDHESGRMKSYECRWSDEAGDLSPLATSDVPPVKPPTPVEEPSIVARSFDREQYLAAVERVREHIYEGDVYQVNLSQRFRFPLLSDPFTLWLQLFEKNPAPFYAWVDAGSHQVLSTSMERFFLVEGDRLETRPIKGTRPSGATDFEQHRFGNELLASAKDDAELSMIVDLERNDLGKICAAGSVVVRSHKQIERYANVQHLVSIVDGQLLPGMSIGDIFRALFPGGSITGCPKIRAMEIIDAIETETRHIYTGSIGYISAGGRADFNIAIRTAVVRDGVCHLSVGGGIVYDSDPVEEYLETLHKGRTFFQLAGIRTELD